MSAQKPIEKPEEQQAEQNQQEKPDTLSEGVQGIVEQAEHEVKRSRVPWYQSSQRAFFFITLYFIEFVLFMLLAVFVHFHPVDWIDTTLTRELAKRCSDQSKIGCAINGTIPVSTAASNVIV